MKHHIIFKPIFGILILVFAAFSVSAATIIVNTVADTDDTTGTCATGGSCTLRQATNVVRDGDTIVFSISGAECPNGVCTINLLQGGLTVTRNISIVGPGAKKLIVQKGDVLYPFGITILTLLPEAGVPTSMYISGLTIAAGSSRGAGGIAAGNQLDVTLNEVSVLGNGGAVVGGIGNSATMTIINSTIAGNGGATGGIYNSGRLTIVNSTISGNAGSGPRSAGGILNYYDNKEEIGGVINLNNVSIVNNSATNSDAETAGGIVDFGEVNIRNTVIAENRSAGGNSPDAYGIFNSQGSNFLGNLNGTGGFGLYGSNDITGSSDMFILGDNGGQTLTHAVFSFSILVDRGDNCVINRTCAINNPPVPVRTDQRGAGYIRNWGKTIDIGAFEYQPSSTSVPEVVSGRVFAPSGGGLANVKVTLTNANGTFQTAITSAFGFFRFDNLQNEQTVTLSVETKAVAYAPQVVTVSDSVSELNFFPQ